MREFFTRELYEVLVRDRLRAKLIESLGDAVLATVRYIGRGASTGLEIDQTFASLYRVRDGKTVSMRDYSTRADALEAAGLSE